jgi:RNA polymerase sigma-70 factor (ECF subfamily)
MVVVVVVVVVTVRVRGVPSPLTPVAGVAVVRVRAARMRMVVGRHLGTDRRAGAHPLCRGQELFRPLARICATERLAVDDLVPANLTDAHAVSDAALTARLACGDVAALDPLYRRHRAIVYRFALLWSGQPALASDVTQDVFVHLLTRSRDFDPARGSLAPWLLGIARNLVRRRTGWPVADPPAGNDDDQAARGLEPEHALIAARDLEALRRAVAALPPRYRDVLVLVELAERSYAEAALICGCELNTVRSRLVRAKALLARWLEVDGGDGRLRKVVE